MKKICAFAPATIANLSVGFDVLGLGLLTYGDKVELNPNNLDNHRITEIISDISLPYDLEKNSCSAVILAMQKAAESNIFVDIRIKKGFKAGSGLGSSAASSVAAAVAYNHLLGNKFSKNEVLKFATIGELSACGSAIYDNVAASLYGGIVLMHNENAIPLPTPNDLYVLAFFQQVEIRTEDARNVLPTNFNMQTVTDQMSNIAAFVHALHTHDLALLKNTIKDNLAEPFRKELIPNFTELQQIAEKEDAIAFGISGSGPTVFALTESYEIAEKIQQKFHFITKNESFESISFIENLKENNKGAFICDKF